MLITDRDLQLLALKLVEVFSRTSNATHRFDRYWPLAAPLEVFSEGVTTTFEAEVAKALRNALERQLKASATNAFHPDAEAVAAFLGVSARRKPWSSRATIKPKKRKR